MKVIESIVLKNNYLTSLPDLSDVIINGDFYCFNNKLTSLEGAPKYVGVYFDCTVNQLTSLKGAPKYVGGDFDCSFNKLTSLEGAPKYVGGSFSCSDNKVKFTEEYVRSIVEVKGKVYV